ncbi:MAG: guanylate kinase [Candidatus Brocadiia bacterium]
MSAKDGDGYHSGSAGLFVLSGPSASGKTSVVKGVCASTRVWFSVSATTRAPRPGETEGVDYFFYTPERFSHDIESGDFLEHAQVHANMYGTPLGPIMTRMGQGIPVLLDIDVQGALQVKSKYPGAVLIFLVPPSRRVLESRLRGRGTESDEDIERRLTIADSEIALSGRYDYLVINDVLGKAIEDVRSIITAESLKMPQGGIHDPWHNSELKI